MDYGIYSPEADLIDMVIAVFISEFVSLSICLINFKIHITWKPYKMHFLAYFTIQGTLNHATCIAQSWNLWKPCKMGSSCGREGGREREREGEREEIVREGRWEREENRNYILFAHACHLIKYVIVFQYCILFILCLDMLSINLYIWNRKYIVKWFHIFENFQDWLSSYYYWTTLLHFQLQFLVSLLQYYIVLSV